MVLAELGNKITQALNKMTSSSVVDDSIVKAILGDIAKALLQSDVNVKLVQKLRENVFSNYKLSEESNPNLKRLLQSLVVKELTNLLSSNKKPFIPKRGKTNVIMFVGLQGAGKTTTCTKYAYYYRQKGWRTALVCADTFRAGAFDQLKQNATKVRIPFYGSYTETDPVQISEEGVNYFKQEGYEIIIVDTSGRHKQETELFEEMQQVALAVKPDEIIFTMDSSIGQACFDQAQAFTKAVKVGSVIITKLDGHAKGGGAISAVAATQSPIVFIGLGEQFDDFEPFEAESFIKRLLGLGDIKKLFESVKDIVSEEDSKKLMKGLKEGKFSLRDFQSQFQSILKMGNINQFMSMIPGLGNSILTKGTEKESTDRIKRFIFILDSCTPQELDNKVKMNESRILRLAKGSGTSPKEVSVMLEEYKKLEVIFKKIGGTNFGKGNESANMNRNTNQIMKKMQNVMDPNMMKQLGGMGNIMNMMKDMSKMEGMGDLMKQFSGGKKK